MNGYFFSKNKITSLLLMVVGFGLIGCDNTAEIEELPLRAVRYISVTKSDSDRIRKYSGVSESDQEAKLSFKVPGNLIKLNVSVGDAISVGQVIAEIDPETYALQLQQSEADFARANSEKRNAQAAYLRVRGLYENQSASKNELDTARAAAESANALVNAAQKGVELARLNLSYTELISATDCSVATTSVDQGENITAGQEIVLVNCGNALNINVSVPESAISDFEFGVAAEVEFDAIPGVVYSGRVSEVGISAIGTTFPVTVSLLDISDLRVGLSAQVSFRFNNQISETIIVPSSAVGEDQDGRYVYVVIPSDVSKQGKIERRNVTVGNIVSSGIEILTGIEEGDRVVTAGVSVIRDGLLVQID